MFAHFAHHLMTALPAPLLPFIRSDFGLSYTQSALVITAFSLAYGLGQLPGGWLADKIGRRALIAVGILGVAAAGILVGISHTYMLMIVFLVIMGLLGGGYHPAATPWISASAGEKKQGRAIGFHFVGGGSGFFVAPLVGAAIAGAWGWHTSFIALAIPSAAFGIIFFIFLRRQKDSDQLKSVVSGHQEGVKTKNDRWRSLAALITMSLIVGGMGSVMSFLSLYLVDQFKVSNQVAGSLVAISSFAGLWAGPVGGHVSDRIGRLPIILISSIIGGMLIFSIRYIPYGIGLFALLFFVGVNMYLGAPVSEAFIMGQTSPRHRSLIYGLYYLSGQGGALFAPLMGHLIDSIGFQSTSTIAGIATVTVAAVCGIFLVGDREKTQPFEQVAD
jgi:MFS family permease